MTKRQLTVLVPDADDQMVDQVRALAYTINSKEGRGPSRLLRLLLASTRRPPLLRALTTVVVVVVATTNTAQQVIDKGSLQHVQHQLLLQRTSADEVRAAYQSAVETSLQVRVLEEAVSALHHLFVEFSILVLEQGERLDSIEGFVLAAKVR